MTLPLLIKEERYMGRRLKVGINDLQTMYPEIAAELDEEKSGFTAKQITHGSKRKAWFKCPVCGESFETKIQYITDERWQSVCPECNKKRAVSQTSYPEQLIYLAIKSVFVDAENRDKVNGFEYDIYISSYKIGIEYDGIAWHSGDKAEERKNKKNIMSKENGIHLIRIKETPRDKNAEEPYMIGNTIYLNCTSGRNTETLYKVLRLLGNYISNLIKTEVEFKISDEMIHTARINSIYVSYEKSLAHLYPEVASEWDYELNGGLTPDKVSTGSNYKVHWICKENPEHRWVTSVCQRTREVKTGCPVCYNQRIITGLNDLATVFPSILKDWAYDLNTIDPTKIAPNTGNKAHFRCNSCQYEWETTLNARVSSHSRCPNCHTEFIDFNRSIEYSIDNIPDKLEKNIDYIKIGNEIVGNSLTYSIVEELLYYIKEKYTEKFNRLITEGLIKDSTGKPIVSSKNYGNGCNYSIALEIYIKLSNGQREILSLMLKILKALEIDYSEVKIKYTDNI